MKKGEAQSTHISTPHADRPLPDALPLVSLRVVGETGGAAPGKGAGCQRGKEKEAAK